MNSSFLATLVAVLSDEPTIPDLPDDRLNAVTQVGHVVAGEGVTNLLLKKVARLQTLCVRETQKCAIPDVADMRTMTSVMSGAFSDTFASAIAVGEDATLRIEMLEQLIVEVVRTAVPSECDYMDVGYHVHESGNLMRCPVLRHGRILD